MKLILIKKASEFLNDISENLDENILPHNADKSRVAHLNELFYDI